MTDMFSKAKRSRIMSNIRSTGNFTTELRFISIMRRFKITGWRRKKKLPGKPDFVFERARVAVFIDGDFWHGNPQKFRVPKTNSEYWREKILGNRKRDQQINRDLKVLGWRVIRFWESNLRDEEAIIAKLKTLLL
jgi:DNA mismatch endonuclease (patch repair protein)